MKRLSLWYFFKKVLFSVVIAFAAGTLNGQIPTITSFTPAFGPVGTSVTITGTNFSTIAADNIVWFGAVRALVTAASATELAVAVPVGATYQPITVTVNGLTAWSGTPFNVIFPSTHIIDETALALRVDFTTGLDPQDFAIGDIDGDGKIDLIVTNANSNTLSIYRNTSFPGSFSAGSFAAKIDLTTGMNPNGIAIGDIDGDGKQDIVVANQSGNTVSIFRNISIPGPLSLGSFDAKIDLPTGYNPYGVTISDIDGDGKPDLSIANYNSTYITIYQNISTPGSLTTGSFAARFDFPSAMNLQNISFGDIDGDKKPDLVVANWNSNTVSIYRNTSTAGSITISSFEAKIDFNTGMNPLGIAIADLDGDGKQDMIISNTGSNSVSIFRNTGITGSVSSGSFDTRIDFTTGQQPRGVTVGDIDADNKPDLVITNYGGNTVSILRNRSIPGSVTTDSFVARVDYSTWTGPAIGAVGDIDGDSKPDLVVVNTNSNVVSVFRNLITEPVPPVITNFAPNSGPIGTTVTITGTNFSTTAAENIVWFGAVQAAVTTASATELTVAVPPGATYQPVTVTVNGLTAYSSAPFIVTFSGTQIIDATSFASKVDFSTGSNPDYIAIGDIDGDGKPDLAVLNSNSSSVSIFRNNSTAGPVSEGSFDSKVDLITGTYPYGISISDLDGDGKPDLVVSGRGNDIVSVFRNTSTSGSMSASSFAPRVDFATGDGPESIAIMDIDGDGKPDLTVNNQFGNSISVFKNTSYPGNITANSFAVKVDFATGTSPRYVALGDLNGDRKPEMVVANLSSATLSVFMNTSSVGTINSGSFAEKADFTTGAGPVDIVLGDFDMDGKSDLSVVNQSIYTVSVFRNTWTSGSITSDSFAPRVDFATGTGPWGASIGDINGDGKPDLVIANYQGNSVSVLRNTSTPGFITESSFAAKVDYLTGHLVYDVVVGDINGDGRPDLSATNNSGNNISVFQNTIPEPVPPVINSFTPASGPVGTTVTITGANFSTTAADNIVWFGAVQATVTAASATQLTVVVPTGATYQPFTITVNGLTAYSGSPFNVTFLGNNTIDASSFAPKVDFTAGIMPLYVAIGDIDGDGRPDLAIANSNSNSVSVFRNSSTSESITAGSFNAKVDFTTGSFPRSVAIDDIDGDGKLDLIVTNSGSNSISVLRNICTPGSITTGSFTEKVDFSTGINPFCAAVRDIDGDGKPDLAVTNYNSGTISVLRNTCTSGYIGAGSFATNIDFTLGDRPFGCVIGDIDGDGKPDLIVTSYGNNTISVFRNTSTSGIISASSFDAKVDFSAGLGPVVVVISDIDGDGKPDLAVTNNTGNSVSVFRNISMTGSIESGSFAAKVDFSTGAYPYYLSVGDINGDGKPDMAAANFGSNSVSVFRNNSAIGSIGTGSFGTKVDFSSGPGSYGLALGDIDGDGKPDMVTTNSNDNTISVLRNTISESEPNVPPAITSFTPGSGPVGTTVTIEGSNFSSTAADNIVWFGAVMATVTAASETELTVTVPTGATYQPITVTVNGLTAYSGAPFNVTFPGNNIIDASAFSTKIDFAAGADPQGAATSDIDGDGKPDLIVANINSNTISVYRNTSTPGSLSSGSFDSRVDFIAGTNPQYVTIGDIDSDGKPDLVVTNNGSGTVSVFRNTSTSGSITAGSFAARVDFPVGTSPIGADIGDIDGDGKPDIVVINRSGNTASVLRNTSSSGSITIESFAASVDFTTGTNPFFAAIDDIDGDGKPDLMVTNFNNSTVSVFRNTSSLGSIETSSFADKVDFSTGMNPLGITIVDVDMDGKNDMIIANRFENSISVFHNRSSSGSITSDSFDSKVDFTTGSEPYCVSVGDIDGDGKPDIAVLNNNVSTISLFRNTSSPGSFTADSFSASTDFNTGSSPINLTLCDLDGDSKPDMVTTNSYDNTISILRNTISESEPNVPPAITSFTPGSGPVGTTVTIEGSNFSSTAADNIVWFGAVKASVTEATDTLLRVTVPPGATYQPITVTVNGLTAYARVPFTVTFPGTGLIDATAFAAKVDFTTGANPFIHAIGDIDGDGKPDLVIANAGGTSISVCRNTSTAGSISTGSFEGKVDFYAGDTPHDVTIGDIDGDGKQDIVVTNWGNNIISIFRNTSSPGSISTGSLAARVDISSGTNPQGIAISDIDADGKPDLVVTNYHGNTISVFKNTGTAGFINSGSFAEKVDFTTGDLPYDVAIGYLDGDSKPDLIVSNVNSNTISVFRNTTTTGSITTSSLSEKVDFSTSSTPYSNVAIGDFDGDSKPDMVIANLSSNSVSVYRNISSSGTITSGSFAPRIDFTSGSDPVGVSVGDIDGDNKPDIAVANSTSNTISVLKNNCTLGFIGASSFLDKVDFVTGTKPYSVSIGDIDMDGKSDLLAVNKDNNSVSVLRNTISESEPSVPPAITSFTPASGPVGTTVTISGSNFSTSGLPNIVWFGAVQGTVTSATASQLTVSVPNGASYQPITVTVNGLTAWSDKPFNLTFPGSLIIDASSFAEKVDFTTGLYPSVVLGDIDVDGKQDVTVSNAQDNQISVFRNISLSGYISTASFASKVDFSAGTNPTFAALGDIDGDGRLDLAVINSVSGGISVFRNTSISGSITAGSFAAKIDFITGNSPSCIAIRDIDGDGRPDMVITNYESNTVSIFRNTSSPGSLTTGSFASKVDITTGANPNFVALSDIDGDGKNDLLVSNRNSYTVSVLRNICTPGSIGVESFSAKVDFLTGGDPACIAIGDLDGDGKPDLTVLNNYNGTVCIFRNTSTSGSISESSFAAKVDFTSESLPIYVSIGDINGDGKPDLAVSNVPKNVNFSWVGGNTISVFRNTSSPGSIASGSFASRVDFATGYFPGRVFIGDIDGDYKPDLLVANSYTNSFSVLRNEITTHVPPVINFFTPASGPVSTTVTINGLNFSTTAGNNTVLFGDVSATVITATATQLTVKVPAAAATSVISVTVNELTAYSDDSFTVTSPVSFEFESSVITSNNDGINDRLLIKNFEAYGTCNIYIYNIRGVLIYSKRDYQNDWDLMINNHVLDSGGYFYVIETEIGVFRGSFSILN